MSARENMKGFAVGLSMTGFAVLSSALSQVPQSVCAGSCQSCYACGLTAVPLLLWIASKARKGRSADDPAHRRVAENLEIARSSGGASALTGKKRPAGPKANSRGRCALFARAPGQERS